MSRVATAEAVRFMAECLSVAGAPAAAARQQAELLLQADRCGHPSHGLNRLELYVNDIQSGACRPGAAPRVLRQTPATAWVDAAAALGATSSHFAMDLAISKARDVGVGWVTVKGANHFGMAGYWAQLAAEQGLIGLAFTNTSPLLAPTRSTQAALGTNPLAVAAAAAGGDGLYLDMATTAVAVGKIEMQRRKGEGIPAGWAQGPDGRDTQDADLAFSTGCLRPLGGAEHTAGYKGYGLAAMVELFCGISSGSRYGHHIRSWSLAPDGEPADLGQCFVCVDPACFAPGFRARLQDALRHWRQLEPTDPELPVLAPGDKERAAAAATDRAGSVRYVPQQLAASAALAARLGVTPLAVLPDDDAAP